MSGSATFVVEGQPRGKQGTRSLVPPVFDYVTMHMYILCALAN